MSGGWSEPAECGGEPRKPQNEQFSRKKLEYSGYWIAGCDFGASGASGSGLCVCVHGCDVMVYVCDSVC